MQAHGTCVNFGAIMADSVVKPGARKSPVWARFGFETNESGKQTGMQGIPFNGSYKGQ